MPIAHSPHSPPYHAFRLIKWLPGCGRVDGTRGERRSHTAFAPFALLVVREKLYKVDYVRVTESSQQCNL